MKRSQIALLWVGAVLALAVIASVVTASMTPAHGASELMDAEAIAGDAGPRGFHGGEVAGRPQVDMSRGNDWQVDQPWRHQPDSVDRPTARSRAPA